MAALSEQTLGAMRSAKAIVLLAIKTIITIVSAVILFKNEPFMP
jgi:hypothetical protein